MEPFDEARKVLTPRAVKTNTAVTLSIGYRRGYSTEFVRRSGTGVDRGITALFHIIRKTKGAHHIAIGFTLRVDITDVLFAVWARIAKLQANAITSGDLAPAVRDSVVDKAAGFRTERVLLMFTNHERRSGIEVGIEMESAC
jgi:hypothetical protein